MSIAHSYHPIERFYVSSAEDFNWTPANATCEKLPPRPWGRQWPVWTGGRWILVEDHRERKAPAFLAEDAQEATDFWLPDDTWVTPPRHVFVPGPLPEGAILSRPEKPADVALAEARAAKNTEIEAGYQAAVAATLTMPQVAPTTEEVVAGAALFAAEDPDGLAYVMEQLRSTRAALLADVEAATTAEAVAAIQVRYAV